MDFGSFVVNRLPMKHVSIVVPDGNSILSSIVGPFKVFNGANDYLKKTGRQPMYDIHLVGLSKDVSLYDGLFSVHPDCFISDVKKTDLIVIPALKPESLPLNDKF